MVNTKFQSNQPSGSGENDFFRVFSKYGNGSHINLDQMYKLSFPDQVKAPYEIRINLAQWFLQRCLMSVNRRRTSELWLRSLNGLDF